MTHRKSEHSFWLVATAAFILLTGIIYFPVLFGKVPVPNDMVLQFSAWQGTARSEAWHSYGDIGDLVTFFYPARVFAARAVQGGELPLWNPYFLGGAPFLASPQSALFYPPNFLYYILSVPTAWTLCMALRLFMSGMFTTLLVRSIGGTRAGSIFSGIVYSLCGFMTVWQGYSMDDAAAWLPFVCYAVLRLRRKPSGLSVALAAIGFAMPILAGHPEAAAHITLVGIALALFTFATSGLNLGFILRFTAAGLLAMGLASIQMIPTLEWLGLMPNALAVRWPPLALNQAFGWISRDIFHSPNAAGVFVPESTAYVGMITLIAAPLGLFHRVWKIAVFFAVLSVAAIGIAYGIEPVHSLANHIPVLAGLKNGRMIFVAGFGLAVLAGLGVSTLEEDIPYSFRRRALALAALTAAFLLTFLWVYKLQHEVHFRVDFWHRPSFSRSMLFAGMIPILWRLYGGLRGRAFPMLACGVIAVDLVTFAYGCTGFAPRNEIFPRAPIFEFLAKTGEMNRFRIAEMGSPYSANANIVYGIPSVDGYEVRLTTNHRVFAWDYTNNRQDGIYFSPSGLLRFNDRRLDMLNVKYLIAAARSPEFDVLKTSPRFIPVYNNGYIAAFENKSVLPRAFAVPASGVRLLPEMDQQLGILRNPAFDPQRMVIVEQLPPSLHNTPNAPLFAPPPEVPFNSNVETITSGINEVSFRTTTSADGVLVVSQTHYPGWKATVDGKPADLFRCNIALTGVTLPAGVHEVRLILSPSSFKIGGAITLLSSLIVGLLAVHVLRSGVGESRIRV